jgi:hypothetical protein
MKRRHILSSSLLASSAALGFTPTQKKANSIIELRTYKLRNTMDRMGQRLNDYLSKHRLPALQRAGISKVGYFGNIIGEGSPYTMEVAEYKSLAHLESTWDTLAADKVFAEANQAIDSLGSPSFLRIDSSLLRSFDGLPSLEMPKIETGRAARVFELRTYESNSYGSLAKKIGMFNNGEIAIFRKTGLNPVFFGETIAGANAPNLTYLLWYDSLAAREANWKAFVAHPEWDKLKATPGLSDAEVVSNISNSLLSPTAYSPIR